MSSLSMKDQLMSISSSLSSIDCSLPLEVSPNAPIVFASHSESYAMNVVAAKNALIQECRAALVNGHVSCLVRLMDLIVHVDAVLWQQMDQKVYFLMSSCYLEEGV